jgi:KTSC domain-containing protein
MRMTFVESSLIQAVGYDAGRRLLEIAFTSGRAYWYADVPPDIYAGLMAAESKGEYFLAHIRDVYEYSAPGQTRAADL